MDPLHSVLINAIVEKSGKILISQRSQEEVHAPGKWTIPGGKIDLTDGNVWNIVEKTCAREVEEETGVKIQPQVQLLTNNTFIRSTGQHVVVLILLCHWQSGKAQPLEDTLSTRWITQDEINDYEFAPNVKTYIQQGFQALQRLD